jgi:hypothetical protein
MFPGLRVALRRFTPGKCSIGTSGARYKCINSRNYRRSAATISSFHYLLYKPSTFASTTTITLMSTIAVTVGVNVLVNVDASGLHRIRFRIGPFEGSINIKPSALPVNTYFENPFPKAAVNIVATVSRQFPRHEMPRTVDVPAQCLGCCHRSVVGSIPEWRYNPSVMIFLK